MFSSFVNFEFRELDAGGLLVQHKNDRWNKVLLCPLWHSERLPRFLGLSRGSPFVVSGLFWGITVFPVGA